MILPLRTMTNAFSTEINHFTTEDDDLHEVSVGAQSLVGVSPDSEPALRNILFQRQNILD